MKFPLFEYPSFRYELDDWEFKKKSLLGRINKQKFIRTDMQHFETDRQTHKNSYLNFLVDLLRPTLEEFCKEAEVSCKMTDAWCVRYQKGDYQIIHNHRAWGFSGILYVDYDPEVHTPTTFMAPWQDPRTDRTLLVHPPVVKEGVIFITPSYTHHYVEPNLTDKIRTVVSFDLLPSNLNS